MGNRVFNNRLSLILISVIFYLNSCKTVEDKRQEISLNGSWGIAKTDIMSGIPSRFTAKVPVPGLVDMAEPAIDKQDTSYENSIYWYKKKFTIDSEITEIARLKINKAKYHTRVYLNGEQVGENVYSFTSSQFDIKPLLRYEGKENELIIAVGCQNNLPDTVINGGDWEKIKYIPGIYDDVKLILSGDPFISDIQTVPDIINEQLRVVAEIATNNVEQDVNVNYVIRESVSKNVIVKGNVIEKNPAKGKVVNIDFVASMPDCSLWSPENPFLYELELSTTGDNVTKRFGMRTFSASRDSGIVFLNGKPYYMRGTNVCIFRFFEDPDRKGLPWDKDWVTRLHGRFKEMNWNSIRYCIGFPPECWYEVADSLGFLIQDEYPIWTGYKDGFEKRLKGVNSLRLANEYKQWMRERWNHPCVVIWDAQNESMNDTTGKAIQIVRNFDLSNRPWENGWARPASKTDVTETHPYVFVEYWIEGFPSREGILKDHLSEKHIPNNGPNDYSPSPDGIKYNNPIIINEYGWIWLNRDGSPTVLTERIYKEFFPDADTPQKRFEAYAKTLGLLTEYWRAHRTSAGVLHFCGLGYSRPNPPRGQTSDNFIDIKNLVYEPHFHKYVKPAFNPVGLMIELWDKKLKPESDINVPVHIINDTYENVSGTMKIILTNGESEMVNQSVSYNLKGLEKKVFNINMEIPSEPGQYTLEASINYKGETIKSIREFRVE